MSKLGATQLQLNHGSLRLAPYCEMHVCMPDHMHACIDECKPFSALITITCAIRILGRLYADIPSTNNASLHGFEIANVDDGLWSLLGSCCCRSCGLIGRSSRMLLGALSWS